jgi:hypothetical protein
MMLATGVAHAAYSASVSLSNDEIEKVARIAELNSLDDSDHPWAGRSLADLLTLTDCRGIRAELREPQLAEWLGSRPRVSQRWVSWSEDKRTSSGYYIVRSTEGWRIGSLASEATWEYAKESDEVAAYILRELDYWAAPPDKRG